MFLSRNPCRPAQSFALTETQGAAMGAVAALTADGLFIGQSGAFFATLNDLATKADMAQRRGVNDTGCGQIQSVLGRAVPVCPSFSPRP